MLRYVLWALMGAVLAVPFLGAVWLFFPVFGAALLVMIFMGRGPLLLRALAGAVVAVVGVGTVLWMFAFGKSPQTASIYSGPFMTNAPGVDRPVEQPEDPAAPERRLLMRELNIARFNIQKISGSIDTLRTADSLFTSISANAQADAGGLGAALDKARSALMSARYDQVPANLLEAGQLSRMVETLTRELRIVEAKAQTASMTASQVKAVRDLLPNFLAHHGVAVVPTALYDLETAIRKTIGARVTARSQFFARYSGDLRGDQVTYEQQVDLELHDSAAESIDLANFFSLDEPEETVSIVWDGTSPQRVTPDAAQVKIPDSMRTIQITRSITRRGAKRPIVNSRYFLSLPELEIRWPSATFPSLVANLRVPQDPDSTWPWTIETRSEAKFAGVLMPRYTYLYSTPTATPVDENESTRLTFAENLKPVDLTANRRIVVQFLPWYLSLEKVQKNKDLLVVENIVFAGIAAALSAVLAFLIARITPKTN